MRLVLTCLFLLIASLPARAQTLDPATLGAPEKRALQTILAYSGTYEALVDGGWGAGSRAAMVARTGQAVLTPASARMLVDQWDALRTLGGWDIRRIEGTRVSLGLPWALMRADGPGRVSSAGGVVAEVTTRSLAETETAHRRLSEDRGPGNQYLVRRDGRLVTSVFLPGGDIVYMRSQPGTGGYVTVRLQVRGPDEAVMDAMAGSIYFDETPAIGIPADSALRRFAGAPAPAPAPALPRLEGGTPSATDGAVLSGFHVSPDIVLTSGPALRTCLRPTVSGRVADIVTRDVARGVTVLRSRTDAADWLSLAPGGQVQGSQRAIGIAAADGGLRAVAASQRGNSGRLDIAGFEGLTGGPVVDAADRVTGLVATQERGGRMASARDIRALLDSWGIGYGTGARAASARAIVPVACAD